jgi:hypothetical protein
MYQIAFSQPARQVDLRDLGAPLATQPALGGLIALGKDGMVVGVQRGFHQPPAQVARPVFRPYGVGRLLQGLTCRADRPDAPRGDLSGRRTAPADPTNC